MWDPEAASWADYAALFAEQRVRQAFVRKVLGIVLAQLLVTVGASVLFYFNRPLKARRVLAASSDQNAALGAWRRGQGPLAWSASGRSART